LYLTPPLTLECPYLAVAVSIAYEMLWFRVKTSGAPKVFG
jgi:hypothetical protein